MKKQVPDHQFVAIIYFTDEEHTILHKYFDTKKTSFGVEVKGHTIEWFEATRRVPTAFGLKFYLMNGLRAPLEAKDFCHALLKYAPPALVVNIGTAGRLADWTSIGDIVMPEKVASWDDDSTISEAISGAGFKLESSANAISLDQQTSISSQFATSYPDDYRLWKRECELVYKDVAAELENAFISLNRPPKIRCGHLASGSSVVKSNTLKNQIVNSNRKYLAVDMESYAVASTLLAERVPVLIIRTVTDPATKEDKDKIDALISQVRGVSLPSVRYYSLSCAAALVKHIVHRHSAIKIINDLNENAANASHLADHIASKLKYVASEERGRIISNFGKYFSNLLNQDNGDRFFEDLLDQITCSNSNSRIMGTPGSGKSTLLSCLYMHHIERWESKENNAKPHYIDLDHYISNSADFGIRADLDLISASMAVSAENVLYVDSLDEYLRDEGALQLQQELRRFVQDKPRLKWVIGVGNSDKRCGLEDKEVKFSLPSVILCELSPCQQNEKNKWDKIIDDFCMVQIGDSKLNKDQIKRNLEVIQARDLDLFTLSLVSNLTLQRSFGKRGASLGSVYFDYVIHCIQVICEVSDEDAEVILREIAAYIYSQQVWESTNSLDSFANDVWVENLRSLNRFVFQHPSIRQFLIAEHILDICLATPDSLGYRIYSYGINRFVKTLANRTDNKTRYFYDGIVKVMEDQPDKTLSQAHLAYLLGRLNLRNVDKRRAEEKLYFYLDRAQKNYIVYKSLNRDPGDGLNNEALDWSMLLLRTLYISLIYMGDSDRAEEYVKELLKNEEWDSLNRGFHMQYYGDLPSGIHRLNMVAKDTELDVSPNEVHKILCKDLNGYISDKRFRPRSFVELHTLLSLHNMRHLEGLLDETLRVDCVEIVMKFALLFRDDLPSWYLGYLDMSIKLLSQPTALSINFVTNVMGLKDKLRSGWSFTGLRSGKQVTRNVKRVMYRETVEGLVPVLDCQPESVADHSWGCAMLAWMAISDLDGIDVNHVIKLLLIHDLPESITGDLCHSKNDIAESKAVAELSAIGYLKRFKGAICWAELFDELERKTSEESKVASDIDKIERYLQAIEYAKASENKISDLPDWKPTHLLSKVGRELLRCIENDLARIC
jgi:5'-deoxynucleotidase YfbR-like HD superfamily hydrolase/nucleoside phosphorylase